LRRVAWTSGCGLLLVVFLSGGCDSTGQEPPVPVDGERVSSRAAAPAGPVSPTPGKTTGDDPGSPSTLERVAIYGLSSDREQRGGPPETVRVVLFFDREATYRRGEQGAAQGLPRRIFLDLERVRIGNRVPAAIPVSAGGLRRLRAFAVDDGTTRVSFDVDDAAAYRLFALEDPHRLIMDFRLSGAAAAANDRRAGGPTVILDPGHGGINKGAVGPGGLKEAVVALQLAKRVRSELKRRLPGVQVVLTRESDVEVSLEERAALANGYDADIFVSIHFNASSSPNDRGGVSTFILDTSDDTQALRLAARENNTSEQDVSALQVILASLYRKEQIGRSERLADLIHRYTLAAGRRMLPGLPDRGVKRALFFVLVGARMPAVLLEASFITKPEEEEALRSDRYLGLLAEGIADGIVRYLQTEKKATRGK
jgi:N-acetylmuramoyl-L-alanine amidase